jgi:hypothetical protein
MEKPQICEEKTDKNRSLRVNFTYKTVNSAESCIFFVHMYRFEGNFVKYTDPDGRRPLLASEKAAFIEVLGTQHAGILNNITYHQGMVQESDIRAATRGMAIQLPSSMPQDTGKYGISLPDGNIFMPLNARFGDNAKVALLIHEIFHQVQYSLYGNEAAFSKLLGEIYLTDPYDYTSPLNQTDLNGDGRLSSLNEINTFEGQAKLVEDFALDYFNGKANGNFSTRAKENAEILRNSGYSSFAINTLLGP